MNDQRTDRRFYLLNIMIPIFAGVLIYLLFRRDTYLSLFAGRYASIPAVSSAGLPVWLEVFLRGYAADILWSYSLAFSVMRVFVSEGEQRSSAKTMTVCFCFICLMESLQKTDMFRGTFDVMDICLETVSVSCALFVIRKGEKKNEKRS